MSQDRSENLLKTLTEERGYVTSSYVLCQISDYYLWDKHVISNHPGKMVYLGPGPLLIRGLFETIRKQGP